MRASKTVVPPPSAKSPSKPPANNPKAKKEVPTAWRDRINPQDYEHLRDVFLIFDEDGSGSIDPKEIVKVLEEVGLDQRNQHVVKIIWALRETNKILTFEEFVDVVCTQVGEYKTKDGLQRVWKLYDKEETGVIRFEQLKEIARSIGEYMDDQAILDMMHGVFINKGTQSNEEFTFDEFYQVISAYYSKGQ
jgi:Ca2+-binding EF-hand superfamily protein